MSTSNPPTPRDSAGHSPRQKTPPLSARSNRGYQGKFSAWGSQLTPRTQGSSDPVHVCVRMKPPEKVDDSLRYNIEAVSTPATTPRTPRAGGALTISAKADGSTEDRRTYEFADVFPPTSTSSQIESVIVPRVVDQLKQGFNAAVMCYGQTGSGKTHTINELTPALMNSVFQMFDDSADDSDVSHVVAMSYIQIYNNTIFNLLANGKGDHGEVLPRPTGTIVAEPTEVVSSSDEVLTAVAGAQRRRVVAQHALNSRSSRSHTLLTLRITRMVDGTPVQVSRVTIADLAGSERLKKTGVAGDGMEEAIAINKSLLALSRVFEAVEQNHNSVPVRDSVLTMYLAETLQNSYMFLVANISLEAANFSETKSTLEFADVARKCVVQRTKSSNTGRGSFEELKRQLNTEIAALRLKVEELNNTVDVERQRSEVLQTRLQAATPRPQTEAVVAENSKEILKLEGKLMKVSNILRDREDELRSLERKKEQLESYIADNEQRLANKAAAMETLSDPSVGVGTTDEIKTILENCNEAFLWEEEMYREQVEKNKLLEHNVATLQQQCHEMRKELLETRQTALKWERYGAKKQECVDALNQELEASRATISKLELQISRERNNFKAQQISIAAYNSKTADAEETANLSKALDEQLQMLSSVESRLDNTEKQLYAAESDRDKWKQKAAEMEELYLESWNELPPSSKGKLTRRDPKPTASFSYDAQQLKISLQRSSARINDLENLVKERELQIEDQNTMFILLQQEKDELESEFVVLKRLEESHLLRGEHLQQQLESCYQEIDAHLLRRDKLDEMLRKSNEEWERLDRDYKDSQKDIDRLASELEQAMLKVRNFEHHTNELTARLEEAKVEKESIRKQHDAERARIERLEEQLKEQEKKTTNVKMLRDEAAHKTRKIWRELSNSAVRGNLMASKLQTTDRTAAGAKRIADLSHRSSVRPSVTAESNENKIREFTQMTRARAVRFEVRQLWSNGKGREDQKEPSLSLRDEPSAPTRKSSAPDIRDVRKAGFSAAQRSRQSLVQQQALRQQQDRDMKAMSEARVPPVPPISQLSRPVSVPPLSLGKAATKK